MTQLDCKRKWKKNKQKQIQKSKQLSLLWVVLICPRKGADPCETSKRFQKSVMPRFVAGHLHEALPGPASRTRLLIPAALSCLGKVPSRTVPVCPERLKTGTFFKEHALLWILATGLALKRMTNSSLVNSVRD